jgi:glycosyltransferase involved in cell wall biosynthesis
MHARTDGPQIAVLVPCFNEAATIGGVVTDLRKSLPESTVYVYDNNSTDETSRIARASGAVVRAAPMQGKGNVVRRMFADIEADVYLLIDGDGTYDASRARHLVDLVDQQGFDLVNGRRVADADQYTHTSHQFGNRILSWLVHSVFGRSDLDMLSGYKAFSRRFVKSLPMFASGFELETELTVHALDLAMPIESVPLAYRARPEGSESKLNTYRDEDHARHRHPCPTGAPTRVLRRDCPLALRSGRCPRHTPRDDLRAHAQGAAVPDGVRRGRPDGPLGARLDFRAHPRHGHQGA